MMTEAGVDVIVPWAAARSVTQWKGDRAAKSLAKWRSTAREAGKQARRFHLPEVAEPVSTAAVEALLGGAALGLVLHEEAAEPLSRRGTARRGRHRRRGGARGGRLGRGARRVQGGEGGAGAARADGAAYLDGGGGGGGRTPQAEPDAGE